MALMNSASAPLRLDPSSAAVVTELMGARNTYLLLVVSLMLPGSLLGQAPFAQPPLEVADGYEVSLAAAPPLVQYPMMACFDPLGRLYIAESDGRNLTTREEIEKELPRFVRRLVDTDGDGIFDESTIFADKMTMPEGGLWHNGALYIISAPYLWRLEDTDDDGVADTREKILGSMEFDGRANQHGPYLGPDGRFYFTGGHFGYTFVGTDGSRTGTSRAAGVFSCFPDGSDVRIDGQGGINPVDVIFTENGDMFSTCAIFDSHGGRHDALVHWLRGGLTQRVYGEALLADSGYRLPATSRWGQVAPAGLVRYRQSTLEPDNGLDQLFACHFNTREVRHLQLVPDGDSFFTEETVILSSLNRDFHPADVLEDADGSLLVLDTGGWLSWGCPHSQIAKPEVKGAIYRLRRKKGPKVPDPRGLGLDWSSVAPAFLVARLGDSRPAVRDRAREALVMLHEPAVAELITEENRSESLAVKKRILWILSRIGTQPCRDHLLQVLTRDERTPGLRQVAATTLGNLKERSATSELVRFLGDEAAPVRLAAATALGQMRARGAVKALFSALTPELSVHGGHAICYALMEIGDVEATLPYLSDNASALHQQTALRVLSQLGPDALPVKQVLKLLHSPQANVRSEAQRVVMGREDWEEHVLDVLKTLLQSSPIDSVTQQQVDGIAAAFGEGKAIQNLFIDTLRSEDASQQEKLAVLRSLQFVKAWPQHMWPVLDMVLRAEQKQLQTEGLALVKRFGADHLGTAQRVFQLAAEGETAPLRIQALEALAFQLRRLDKPGLDYLYQRLADPDTEVVESRQVAQALGQLDLTHYPVEEAMRLTDALKRSRPLQADLLLMPLTQLTVADVPWSAEAHDALGLRVVEALAEAPLEPNSLPLERLLEVFPRGRAHIELRGLEKSRQREAAQRGVRMKEMLESLPEGNASRGRILFSMTKSTCSLCHQIQENGGTLGPSLSKIGSIRTRRDLLEALVYPNATVVNGYETYNVELQSGHSYVGVVHQETADTIYLLGADQQPQLVLRRDIAKMQRLPQSMMPSGLENLFSPTELADLLAYLEACR